MSDENDSVAGGGGSFPLRGSGGRGGENASSDVRAVPAALGLAADGDCGPKTIAAIKAYQKKMGQAKADGRVDVGGTTERALAGVTATVAVPAMGTDAPIATYSIDEPESGTVGEQVYKQPFRKLPTYVLDDLLHGDASNIEVHGDASNTDKQGDNDKLSKRRAKAVVDVLIGRGVSDNALTSRTDRSCMAPTDDEARERESAAWRKVVPKIKGEIRVAVPKVAPGTLEAA
jgi:outer membrane protein OmpA-like peptidoglycan-associated protein